MTSNGQQRAKPLRTGDPHELDEYRIVGRLGRGGMGTVYLARDSQEREVAIKLIHPDLSDDEAFRRRFAREVEAARRVARFSTAAVLDAKLEGEPLYIVSEYVAGPNLAEAIEADGPMSGGTLESLAMGVAAALAAIHGSGVVHRDLKPANVLLSAVGPKVIDFGIARALEDEGAVTRSSQLMGTPAYLAPELILGQSVSPASDIFSWGCLVAFAGTGKAPFDAPTVPAVLHQISTEQPNLTGLDPTLRILVAEALDKSPEKRPSAQRILDRLVGHEAPSVAEVDQTVVRSWTPPSTAAAMAGPAAGEAAPGSGPQQPITPTTDLSSQATAAFPGAPQQGPEAGSTRPYDVPSPPAGSSPYPPPGGPSGPQPPYGQSPYGQGPPPYGVPGAPSPPYGQQAFPPGPPGGPSGPNVPMGGGPSGANRRPLLIAGAIAAVLLLTVTVIAVARIAGGPRPPEGNSIFTDDFANINNGWAGGEEYQPGDSGSEWGYYDNQFVLRAYEDNENLNAAAPYGDDDSPPPDRISLSVDAEVSSGPEYGKFGLYCFRNQDEDTRYAAYVRIDGGEAEIRRTAGEGGESALNTVTDVPGFDVEEGAVNNLHLSCELDSEAQSLTMRLWVNGEFVLEAEDDDPVHFEEERDIGVTAWRTAGGGDDVVILFDNFNLYQLTDSTG